MEFKTGSCTRIRTIPSTNTGWMENSDRIRDNDFILKEDGFQLSARTKFFPVGMKHYTGVPERLWMSHHWKCSKARLDGAPSNPV